MMSDASTRFNIAGSGPSGHGSATAHRQHHRQLVGHHSCQLHYVHHYVHHCLHHYVDHCLMHCLVHGPKVPATANAQLDSPKLDPCDDLGSVL